MCLSSLPELAFLNILKYLNFEDKKNLRLLDIWMSYMIVKLEPSLRKWNIKLTKSNLENQALILKTAHAKQTNINTAHKGYEIELEFNHESLVQVPADQRLCFFKDILDDWKESITDLKIGILGDETFLLNSPLAFTKLTSLSLRSCNDLEFQIVDRGYKDKISTKIIEDNGSLLQTLAVKGSLELQKLKTSLPLLKTLKVNRTDYETLITIFKCCKESLTGIELNMFNEEIAPDDFPKDLQHLVIESSHNYCLDLIYYFRETLKTLKITNYFSGERGLPHNIEFQRLEVLWLDSDVLLFLLASCVELKHLVISNISVGLALAPKFSNLKSIVIQGDAMWCLELVKANEDSLEMLCVINPFLMVGLLDYSQLKLSNLKYLLLPLQGDGNLYWDSRYPHAEVISKKTDVFATLEKYGRKLFPYPSITQDFQGLEYLVK